MASDELLKLEWTRDIIADLYARGYLTENARDDAIGKVNAEIDELPDTCR